MHLTYKLKLKFATSRKTLQAGMCYIISVSLHSQ